MTKREKLCLQMRNSNGQENETYCKHYIKNKSGYLRFLFCKFQSTSVFIFFLICLAACFYFKPDNDFLLLNLIPSIIAAIAGLAWIFTILKGLWYWKYAKHVFVTNDGIWVMTCSALWWKGAPDFMGKRRFLAPRWSLYTWAELKAVSTDSKIANRSPSKLANVFDGFDRWVLKSSKLSTIYLKRWDGVEMINFLKNEDVEEIIEYAKIQKRNIRKSRKTKTDELEPPELCVEADENDYFSD